MSINVQPLLNRIRPFIDIGRPLQLATVVDVSGYTTSGPGYVRATIDGVARDVIWRDAPAPAIGSAIQVVRTSAAGTAPWLGLPSAPPAGGGLLFSAFDRTVATSDDTALSVAYVSAIIRRDPGTGHFSIIANHPITGSNFRNCLLPGWPAPYLYARGYPIKTVLGKVYTWVWWLDEHTWDDSGAYFPSNDQTWGRAIRDDVPNCWISGDGGYTWAASGSALYGLRYIDEQGAGTIYAVVGDGQHIARSTDSGATWTTVHTANLHEMIHRCAADPTNADGCSWNTRYGTYCTDDNFTTVSGPYGPEFFDASDGADDFPHDFVYRHGGKTFSWSGHGNIPNAKTVTGSTVTYGTWGTVWAGSDPLTSMARQQLISPTVWVGATVSGLYYPDGSPFSDYQSFFTRDGDDLYFLSQSVRDGSIYKSTDGGVTWVNQMSSSQQGPTPTLGPTGVAGMGAAGGLARQGTTLWAASSMGSIFGNNQLNEIDYDPVTATFITGKQRLYSCPDGGSWVEDSDPFYADTSTDPNGVTGRQYVFFAHGMTAV